MKRVKKHRIKREMPESSQIRHEEHDLAYYIHDRVELMHQIFSVLKHKELRAMAPECIRHISLDDLQELCTEELLGISSKRLCAILDGADPPSNTESSSSSPERFETISLDSISSDEEILSQGSSKRNKKHKHHRHSKSKHKDKHKELQKPEEDDNNKASRAGLTVLELLELQARARAIRAQLQQHQALAAAEQTGNQASSSDDDDEVVIKEEAPEVVEISSEDEKPSAQELQRIVENAKPKETPVVEITNTVTKRINDLIITVPQTKATRKIKLNRPKSTKKVEEVPKAVTEPPKPVSKPISKETVKDKKKKKQKKKDKQKDGSDHDEITLQLSDSEKMDLLEDFDRNRASSEDSESSSDTSESSTISNDRGSKKKSKTPKSNHPNLEAYRRNSIENDAKIFNESSIMEVVKEPTLESDGRSEDKSKHIKEDKSAIEVMELIEEDSIAVEECKMSSDNQVNEVVPEVSVEEKVVSEIVADDLNLYKNDVEESLKAAESDKVAAFVSENKNSVILNEERNVSNGIEKTSELETNSAEDGEIVNKNLSDGELSEHSIAEQNLETEVVCISDEESQVKKKKKKEKKSKKSKKSDFRESADQNFYKINESEADTEKSNLNANQKLASNNLDTDDKSNIKKILDTDDSIDDVFEYLELSDDSSCYEVEGISILSKEPTAKEIVALSARIDDIKREDVITEDEIKEYKRQEQEGNDFDAVENVSWKDRYLESKKVKSVLSTSNILNALRKKNKKLKKHIEETKIDQVEVSTEPPVLVKNDQLIEGSIQHYNTLEGSTKFVDPVKEPELVTEKVSKEMEKDAKQLLKMYKKLLKYNNMNKKKDPNKKKKKKQKKNKDEDKS